MPLNKSKLTLEQYLIHSYCMILCSFKMMHFHYTVENLLFYHVLIATYCLKLFLWTEGKKHLSEQRSIPAAREDSGVQGGKGWEEKWESRDSTAQQGMGEDW